MRTVKSSKRKSTTKKVELFLLDVFNVTKNESLVLRDVIFKPDGILLTKKHKIADDYSLKLFLRKELLHEKVIDGVKYYKWIGADLSNENELLKVANELHTHVYNVKRISCEKLKQKKANESSNIDTQSSIEFENDTVVLRKENNSPTIVELQKKEINKLRLKIVDLEQEIEAKNKRFISLQNRLTHASKVFERKNKSMKTIKDGLIIFSEIFFENSEKFWDDKKKKEKVEN